VEGLNAAEDCGEGNSCHGSEWVSGHGDYHGGGGRGSSGNRSTMTTTMTTTAQPQDGADGVGTAGLLTMTTRMRPMWLDGGGDNDDTSLEDDPARRLASRRRKAAVAAAAAAAVGITKPACAKTMGGTGFGEDAKRVGGAPPKRLAREMVNTRRYSRNPMGVDSRSGDAVGFNGHSQRRRRPRGGKRVCVCVLVLRFQGAVFQLRDTNR
jgi:hypothetical protein